MYSAIEFTLLTFMAESIYTPKGKLSNIVKYVWYSDDYTPQTKAERVLPGGSSQIIINLGERRFRHFHTPDLNKADEYDDVILSGMRTSHVYLDSHSRISTMGVVLQNGAVPALFDVPAGEFQDQVVSLRDLAGSDISEWSEKLIEAPTVCEKFQRIEEFLSRLLTNSPTGFNPAVINAAELIRKSHGVISISEILNQTGYSRRWFSEVFRNTVGVNPKQYARLCRFQNAVSMLRDEAALNSTDIALRCGYFDQSHFIHDFKDFAGISPSEYFRAQGDAVNHLAMENEI